MNKVAIAKKIVTTIVGVGTTKIVKGIIENNVSIDTKTDQVTVTAASAAIGYASSEYMSSYTDAKIDKAVDWWQKKFANKTSN